MREILFRGKRTDNHKWIEGTGVFNDSVNTWIFANEPNRAIAYGMQHYIVNPETVGQYTGLTDKNDKKIFEGDIIKSCEYDEVYCVKYFADDNYPAFDVVPEMNITCNGLSHLHIVEGIEVIGNVHDNPELLKGGEE